MANSRTPNTRRCGADLLRTITFLLLANPHPGNLQLAITVCHCQPQREYLTTSPDGLGVNNLLNLPDC